MKEEEDDETPITLTELLAGVLVTIVGVGSLIGLAFFGTLAIMLAFG